MRRLLAWTLVVLLVTVGAWWARRFRAAPTPPRTGPPVHELLNTRIGWTPGPHNAWPVYAEVLSKLALPVPGWPPSSLEDDELAEGSAPAQAWLRTHEPLLEPLIEASQMERWGRPYERIDYRLVDQVKRYLDLGTLLDVAAYEAEQQGDIPRTLALLEARFRIGRQVWSQALSLDHMIGSTLMTGASSSMRRVLGSSATPLPLVAAERDAFERTWTDVPLPGVRKATDGDWWVFLYELEQAFENPDRASPSLRDLMVLSLHAGASDTLARMEAERERILKVVEASPDPLAAIQKVTPPEDVIRGPIERIRYSLVRGLPLCWMLEAEQSRIDEVRRALDENRRMIRSPRPQECLDILDPVGPDEIR